MNLSPHTRRAARIILAALGLAAGLGMLFAVVEHIPLGDGVYYGLTTASTVGYGDITPHGWLAKSIAVLIQLTAIPLFAAALSLVTADLTTDRVTTNVTGHIDKRHEELKGHLEK